MRLGFTGTQEGMTDNQQIQLRNLLERLKRSTIQADQFHHGDCIGADEQAHFISIYEGIDQRIIHPPIIQVKRAFCRLYEGDISLEPKEYMIRNHDIVDCTDTLIGCPKGMTEEVRSGTWATIRYAKVQRKIVHIIYPDGNMITEGPTRE